MNKLEFIPKSKLQLSILSELSNIPKAEKFIETVIDWYELPEKLHNRIRVAVIEAVNNAILHGNKQDPSKTVKLTAWQDKQKLIITVEDEGEGVNFEHIANPTTPENLRETNGRGLYLMASLTDELLFVENGAKIAMIFSLDEKISNKPHAEERFWC